MAKLFNKVEVLDTCFCEKDMGWSFVLKLDNVPMNAWYNVDSSELKLWYNDIEIILRGESRKLLEKDLGTSICFYKLPEYKVMNFNHV